MLGSLSKHGAVVHGDVMGSVTANNATVHGNVLGDLNGSDCIIKGNVAGDVTGSRNTISGAVAGDDLGQDNTIGSNGKCTRTVIVAGDDSFISSVGGGSGDTVVTAGNGSFIGSVGGFGNTTRVVNTNGRSTNFGTTDSVFESPNVNIGGLGDGSYQINGIKVVRQGRLLTIRGRPFYGDHVQVIGGKFYLDGELVG